MPGGPFTILGCSVFPKELSALVPLSGIPAVSPHSNNVLNGEGYIYFYQIARTQDVT